MPEVGQLYKEVAKLDEGFLNTISSQSLHCWFASRNSELTFLCMFNLRKISAHPKVLVLVDPICPKTTRLNVCLKGLATTGGASPVLLGVEQHEGQGSQHNGEPVSINHEEKVVNVDSGFGDVM